MSIKQFPLITVCVAVFVMLTAHVVKAESASDEMQLEKDILRFSDDAV